MMNPVAAMIQPAVDAVTLAVEAAVDEVPAPVEALIDAFALAIQPLIDAVTPVPAGQFIGGGGARPQAQTEREQNGNQMGLFHASVSRGLSLTLFNARPGKGLTGTKTPRKRRFAGA